MAADRTVHKKDSTDSLHLHSRSMDTHTMNELRRKDYIRSKISTVSHRTGAEDSQASGQKEGRAA